MASLIYPIRNSRLTLAMAPLTPNGGRFIIPCELGPVLLLGGGGCTYTKIWLDVLAPRESITVRVTFTIVTGEVADGSDLTLAVSSLAVEPFGVSLPADALHLYSLISC